MVLEGMIEIEGGKVIRTKVGDVNITKALKKHNAVFGGEPCGAWIHPKYHYCPDGILSSILLIKILEETDQKLSDFIRNVPQFRMVRRNIVCPNSIKSLVMKKVYEVLPVNFTNIKEQSKVDGFRLTLKQGWLLVRPSGTEPLMRITAEAESGKAANVIAKKAVRQIDKIIKETMYESSNTKCW
jgi:phosphoglucosamine mutase